MSRFLPRNIYIFFCTSLRKHSIQFNRPKYIISSTASCQSSATFHKVMIYAHTCPIFIIGGQQMTNVSGYLSTGMAIEKLKSLHWRTEKKCKGPWQMRSMNIVPFITRSQVASSISGNVVNKFKSFKRFLQSLFVNTDLHCLWVNAH